ncbi:unnamed protein product [Psylliodes chrysocephalus]|uniref:Uncharacterized protein n=1 Tax=Psylliodes chrysocephalus TaxID=3402493 RepID=A0A9P0GC17_9CUCU|nr:unnamed protein product [Psylliodes chrysocephala]
MGREFNFKVRIMEQKLAWSVQSDANSVQIHRLEGEVEEQRQLRLHDAKQVEAKAARIKEWVTNKLKELEIQNQTLREQNIKCNQQLELLRNHLALTERRRSESTVPAAPPDSLSYNNLTQNCIPGWGVVRLNQPLYFQRKELLTKFPPPTSVALSQKHRRHQSVCLSTNTNFEPVIPSTLVTSVNFGTSTSSMDPFTDELRAAVDNLNVGRIPSSSASDPDLAHDYAEIYTPSREKAIDGTNTHSRSSGDTTGSSPGKRTASSSSGSPSKSKTRGVSDTSFESGMSDDYAVPPDALSCDTTSLESSMLLRASSYLDSPKRIESLEKCGSLAKLAEGSNTFEIDTGKKTYYLTADSLTAMEEWVRILQNVQRRNATKLLLSRDENKPILQGVLKKVKNGIPRECWCVLIGKMFLYFKKSTDQTPHGQINLRDTKVEEIEHLSDSDSEEQESDHPRFTVGIFPNNQAPTYLHFTGKQEKDSWLYHLTVASGGGPNTGTQYEQLIHKLMEVDGDPNCVLWRHPILLHVPCTKDGAVPSYFPLTSLPTEVLQAEAIKLFKCLQLFMSAAVDQAGIDYHVVLAQNALQQCLDMPELQSELICALVKQTSKSAPLPKLGVQVSTQKLLKKSQLLLCATQSLFTCETNTPSINSTVSDQQIALSNIQAAQEEKYKEHKECYKEHKDPKGPPIYTLLQGWQLLALAVSLFVPKNSMLLWFLKLHLQRNAENRTECGKYAAYCERALERTILAGQIIGLLVLLSSSGELLVLPAKQITSSFGQGN